MARRQHSVPFRQPPNLLETHWADACFALGSRDTEAVDRAWLVLSALYLHPKRRYHNLAHIAQCISIFFLHRDDIGDQTHARVLFAVCAHDCVYDATRTDNEARSAAVASMLACDLGISISHRRAIERLIMATTHKGTPANDAEALIRDVDLSSLAAPWRAFNANTTRIRSEFAHVSDTAFRSGRAAFFRGMLARPSIYFLPRFQERFEARARENLARSIKKMSGPRSAAQ